MTVGHPGALLPEPTGYRIHKEADMASKTNTAPADTMTGKGKGGTVTQHGGTTTGYQRGCRCDECKAAMSAYTTARREASKSAEQVAEEKKAAKAAKAKARREARKGGAFDSVAGLKSAIQNGIAAS